MGKAIVGGSHSHGMGTAIVMVWGQPWYIKCIVTDTASVVMRGHHFEILFLWEQVVVGM